ncbi:acyl-CoA N-acyltransferase [Teratosphaeria nubilosa]|uniref:Acyl-CoA N-acyltransferase n=1 Tax=Teratosphaeria nubilosa TaxID=161662 RepID=A0A6G1LF51_9PEZI|nr:acyl-CoA N-acyltransferase [Teratosphaeria nubilosa]
MAMKMQPLQAADIPAYVQVELEAFRTHPRMPMLYPRGYTPDLDARIFKVVDERTGKIVACSEWTFALDPKKTAESIAIDPDEQAPPNYPEGGNWAITRFYKNEWEKWRRETLAGKAYITLDILVVHPAFQRRGAGTQLLSWGCEQADKLGVPIVLESTPAGLSLYQRVGFKHVNVVAADMEQFGWHEPCDEDAAKRSYMIREPAASSS